MTISKIAVIGPGLLGGSIALAVRERLPEAEIALWARRPEAVAEIHDRNIAAVASTDLAAVVRGAHLVILCVPVGAMPKLTEELAPVIDPETIVTDVGSVKGSVVTALAGILSGSGRFIGSHPMAGSERTGLHAARADLFEGAACIVTPDESSDPEALRGVKDFWSLLGCRVSTLSPAEHDRVVAFISHLPHLTAAALVEMVATQHPGALAFCGNGFRDTTRVAAGPAEMWTEIALSNREPLRTAIEAMIEKLGEVVKLLDANDPNAMTQFLCAARQHRKNLP